MCSSWLAFWFLDVYFLKCLRFDSILAYVILENQVVPNHICFLNSYTSLLDTKLNVCAVTQTLFASLGHSHRRLDFSLYSSSISLS